MGSKNFLTLILEMKSTGWVADQSSRLQKWNDEHSFDVIQTHWFTECKMDYLYFEHWR